MFDSIADDLELRLSALHVDAVTEIAAAAKVSPMRLTFFSARSNPDSAAASASPIFPSRLNHESGVSRTASVVAPGASSKAIGYDHQRSNSPFPFPLDQKNGRAAARRAHKLPGSVR